MVGDPGAIKRAQQSGLQFGGNGGLASIPLFDMSGTYNADGGYHYQWTHFATRDGWPKRTAADTSFHNEVAKLSNRVRHVRVVGLRSVVRFARRYPDRPTADKRAQLCHQAAEDRRNGIDLAGVHQIESRVPLGTSTGWNIRSPAHRGPNLCVLTGSYFPFATTKAERLQSGDPRPSLQELYGSHQGFVNAVAKAAAELVKERFLLEVHADADISAAEASTVLN